VRVRESGFRGRTSRARSLNDSSLPAVLPPRYPNMNMCPTTIFGHPQIR
jgi:hypothetical protein